MADGISNPIPQEKIGVQGPSGVQRDLPAAVFLVKRPGNPAYQWHILLTSGDIETNADPTRWPCGKCVRSAKFDSIRCGHLSPPCERRRGPQRRPPQLQIWPTDKCSKTCADANAHGSSDRPKITDHAREEIDDWAIDKKMYNLNQGAPTRMKSDGSCTSPDIKIVHSSSSQAFSWKTLDSISSDHLPILIDRQGRSKKGDRRRRQLNIRKADMKNSRTS